MVSGTSPDRRGRERLALAALVVAGLALRLWGLDYGLPHPTARPDEEVLVAKLLGFDAGDPNPHWFAYPTLFLYLLYGWVKGLLLAAHGLGLYGGPTALAALAREHPARLYLLARALSALIGTGAIAVTFALGRAVWDARAGLAAALMLSVSFLHVRDSHFFKPDAALAFFSTAALLACVRLDRRGSWGAAVLAGVACGLAMGVKYWSAMAAPLAVAALLGAGDGPTRPRAWLRLLIAGAAAAAALVASSPYIVLDYPKFASWMAYARFWTFYGGEGAGSGLRYHAEYSWWLAQGPLLSLFTLAALLWHAASRRLLLINVFLLGSLAQLAAASAAYTRYVTPILPAVYVVCGVAVARVLERARTPRARAVLAALLLAALLERSFASAVRFDRLAARPDTRLLARAWLREHVPQETTLLVLGAPWPFTFGDPVLDGYRVRRNPTLDPALGIRWVVTHEHPIPFSQPPEGFAALRPRLRLEATFSPFAGDGAAPGTVFETRDAFYLPVAGLCAVERGGPVVKIWSVER